ncbi:hypothetical protein [uncultured Clostridium sp.]|uniref:hypothetical protein n=1 Tax=uncultured Clostridium sp. TaxID=59620 RepID=UPI002607CE9B|nr:hypothetical protein [uncultured Clostridium sp.]
MRMIQFNLANNSIVSDDNGSNESIKIKFTNAILNESIVKLNRGAYIEKILLDTDTITVSDILNVSPYFYVNDVKIYTDKNYTFTTQDGSSSGSGDIVNNIFVDNEDVLNQLGIIVDLITDCTTISENILA